MKGAPHDYIESPLGGANPLPEFSQGIEGDGAVKRSIMEIAQAEGDISDLLDDGELTRLGAEVVEDYRRDLTSREPWAKKVEEALKAASQEAGDGRAAADLLFDGASDVHYPILTVASLQFNARAYPAIFKGDEVVKIKVVGKDAGKAQVDPATGEPAAGPDGAPMMVGAGRKAARAGRVKDYMNVVLGYRVDDWEGDTDSMLLQLPIVGCAFRKLWWDSKTGLPCASFLPALRLVVPMDAKSLKTTPRATEEVPDVYPYQIRERIRSGQYRDTEFSPTGDDKEAPRMLLEQHRRIDMDGDGLGEPYIVTVDLETSKVLRIEANFGPHSLTGDPASGRIDAIEPGKFYVKYEFFPHPEGKFYSIGFGHLLGALGDVINTTINQMLDAGHAQIAGGGWFASGIRLQGNKSTIRWQPGEYKAVNVPANDLKNGIVERTFPNPSPIMFQLLDMMLGAARDIAAIKDVTSGEASNNGQVGTTLALIEQGLQVFTAIYKRVYRGLKEEFQLLYDNLGSYGDERTEKDYQTVLDDETASFRDDFNAEDMDIRPVSDPGSVTRMQKMAQAQFLEGQLQYGILDPVEVQKRVLEAADIEDADKLFKKGPPAGPPPDVLAKVEDLKTHAVLNLALAKQADANTAKLGADTAKIGVEVGHTMGVADGIQGNPVGPDVGGLSDMAGAPGQPVGVPGAPDDGSAAAGPVDPSQLATGAGGPAAAAGIANPG